MPPCVCDNIVAYSDENYFHLPADFSPFTKSEKEIPNILLQVAAKWDGESNPARIAASVILPYF